MSTTYNFSNLDFDVLKIEILNYVKESDIFVDYQFDGSALNSIANLITYITLQQNFYLSMVTQELYLDTAKLYRNAVAIAKSLNYIPKRKISALAEVNISFPTLVLDGSTPLHIPKYTLFTVTEIPFITMEEYYISDASITPIKLYQRETKQEIYEYENIAKELDFGYEIDDQEINNNVIVTVYPDSTLVGGVIWELYESSIDATKYSEIYFLETNLNDKLVISFGDNTIGKRPVSGSWIQVDYGVTTGINGNGFTDVELAEDVYSGILPYTGTQAEITWSDGSSASVGGLDEESLASIKYRAPKFYEAQNRAVTNQDYHIILEKVKEEDEEIDFDIANIWDGTEEEPPTYGTVFAVFKPLEVDSESLKYPVLTTAQKLKIKTAMKNYMPVALILNIKDPMYIYVDIASTVYYDYAYDNPESLITEAIKEWFIDELDTYESSLKYSNLLSLIDDIDGVINNLTEITLYLLFDKTVVSNNIYIFETFNELKPGSISITQSDIVIIADDSEGNILNSTGEIIGSVTYSTGYITFVYADVDAENNKLVFDTLLDDVEFVKNNLPILMDVDINLTMQGK